MQKTTTPPPSARARRLFRQIGREPSTWQKLAYARSYALKHGMRAAKLSAAIECIRHVRRSNPLPLP